MTIPWWVVCLFTSVVLIGVEYINRHSGLGLIPTLIRTSPLIIAGQIGLFYTFRLSPSWLLGWCVFFTTNAILRAGVSHASGEDLSLKVFMGLAMAMGGAYLIKTG